MKKPCKYGDMDLLSCLSPFVSMCIHSLCAYVCAHFKCYPLKEQCDGRDWCIDASDEEDCPRTLHEKPTHEFVSPPAVVNFDGRGGYTMHAISTGSKDLASNTEPCQPTHFHCLSDILCLPIFVRCNGVYDCSTKEDELGCDDPMCPGYYRCRGSAVCVHPDHVCDDIFQCPQKDDELLCKFTCPHHCTCLGLAFRCVSIPQSKRLPADLRALDASGSNVVPSHLLHLTMLVYLDLAQCQLHNVSNLSFLNLQKLSLRQNWIKSVGMKDLMKVPMLTTLYLSDNPITSLFSDDQNTSLPFVRTLDMSDVPIVHFDVSVYDVFPNLQCLNLSSCGIKHLSASRLGSLSKLQVVDLRGSTAVEFPPTLFLGLSGLQQVYGDTYKLCCPQVMPVNFNLRNCHAPDNDISSCKNLLRSDVYRVFLAVFVIVALIGNAGSLFLRTCFTKSSKVSGHSVFVTHLCMSDCLMGVYLLIIGAADRLYANSYLWQDVVWKHSLLCKTSGFVALLSTEMSAFIILLITLDRFLVIRFPFSQLRFQRGSAHVVCCVHWAVVSVLVAIPFFPAYSHWGFYSHTDICIPLPITRSSFAGHSYAFGVMIVLNMVLFLAIAAGQTAIYVAIRSSTMASTDSSRKRQDLDIARRLITVAVTDFCCWFPVGLVGVLAATGTPVPSEVNVAMATLVIPLNSAMNPFLYTMNIMLEKRRRVREAQVLQYLKSQSDKV